jgi:hypothetical protein
MNFIFYEDSFSVCGTTFDIGKYCSEIAPVECCKRTKAAEHLALMVLECGLALGFVFSSETRGGIPF